MAFRGLTLTGARARLTIGGVKIALATNVSISEEIQHDPIEALDDFAVKENVPVAYRVTFSAQMVRIITNTIKNRDGIVIFPRLEDILSQGELEATIEDPNTGTAVATVERVKATRYTNNIGARGIVLTDVEFVAIRIRNESEVV